MPKAKIKRTKKKNPMTSESLMREATERIEKMWERNEKEVKAL
jgi:hypothetical protein